MEAITLDLGENGGVHTFQHQRDAEQWLDIETKFWGWIEPAANRRGELSSVRDHFNSAFQQIRHSLQGSQNSLEPFKNVVIDTYRERPELGPKLPHSTSSLAKLIDEHRRFPEKAPDLIQTRKQILAAMIAAQALGIETQHQSVVGPRIEAGFILALWRNGWTTPDRFADGLHAILSTANLETSKLSERFTAAKNELDETLRLRREQTEIETKRHTAMMEKHQTTLNEQETIFTERLSFEAPIRLWNTRHKHHSKLADQWGIASAVVGLLVLASLICLANRLLPDVRDTLKSVSGTIDAKDTTAIVTQLLIASAAKFAVIALLATWLLRIIIRNYLSHVHLAADAKERAAVIQTFLGLTKDQRLRDMPAVQDKGLPMALERAFAKTQDGIVKDDAMPTPSILPITPKL